MTARDNNEIRTAPADLYDRLHGVDERLFELRRELREIHREYGRLLGSHPEALAVDDLGDPIDLRTAAARAMFGLQQADDRLQGADSWLRSTRIRYATRLKLTDQAAEDLDRRRAAVERGR